MPPAIIGGAISAGSNILGGLLGSSAASKAAAAQQAAAAKASGLAGAAGTQAQDFQTNQLAGENANSQPFIQAGQGATSQLSSLLAPGGQLTQGYGQFNAPTAEQAQNTPGYQFQLQQGLNALQNSAAARGGLLSTGTAKNLENYSQGLASTNYQNAYSNALNAYNTNFNTFNTGQNNLYNRLSGLAGQGANSAANLNSVQQQGTNNLSNILMGTAQTQGQDLMGGANAQAAGIVGSNNALVGGLTGAANNIGGAIQLNQLLGAQNAGNSSVSHLIPDPGIVSSGFPG